MFQAQLHEFVRTRERTLATVARLTQPESDFAPRPGRWSIGEVLDHLRLAEDLYRGEVSRLVDLKRSGRRPYIRRTTADINVAPAFVPDAAMRWLGRPLTMMNAFVPDAVRDTLIQYAMLPARNPDAATPRAGRPIGELRRELEAGIAATRALFQQNADLDFRELISEHPLMGVSDGLRVLRFLDLHEQRHQAQIARVTADARFPRRASD